ncbi:unnamed protein product [Alopecurus aequalis]
MDVKKEPVDAVVISDDELCPGSKTIRGPNKKGSDTSAPFCEYGNTVAMDHYQYFTKSYTKKYLRGHLKKDVTVKVTHHKTETSFVKMKLMRSKGDRRAMMRTQWMNVVNQPGGKFKKGDILLLWIRRAKEEAGGLKLIVKKLKPCGGGCY